jgi:ATP-dependent DNA helicase RecQ
MKDQIDQLRKLGIAAERMDSTLTADESRAIYGAVQNKELRLLYVAPERFNNERFREMIGRIRVSLFAVDEAHCISEWGHNFRPDYLKLAGFAKLCNAERLLALTATATPRVLDDICAGFDISPECAVRTGFYRSNLKLLASAVSAPERDDALLERLSTSPVGPTIVYVTLQRTSEEVAARLAAAGHPARAYHAGMSDEERSSVQDWFIASNDAVVVATIAFGMGIDKANIRYVYHYNLPKSIENYSQEIGRSGRDGLPSTCELFVCPDVLNTLENFVYGDTPTLESIASLLDELFGPGAQETRGAPSDTGELDVSLYDLSNRHDIRPLVLRTLLTYLELDGYLLEGTPYYASYQFRPLISSAEILGRFEGERRDFIAAIFRQSRQAKIWFHIDLKAAAQATGQPRDRYVRALDYLAQEGWIELKAEGVRNRFRQLGSPENLAVLAQDLHERTLERERRELARLHELLELAAYDGCLAAGVSEHFGETLPTPCGTCSWCTTGLAAKPLEPPRTQVEASILREAVRLRADHPEALTAPRAFTRFLCGLSSPRLSRGRLTANPLYGVCAHIPFADVLAAVEGL